MRLVAKQMEPDAIGLECEVSSKACLAVVDMEGLLAYHSRPSEGAMEEIIASGRDRRMRKRFKVLNR